MPYLTLGDDRLYYETHGEGPAIVLAHGVGGNHAIWFRQVPTLSKAYQVVLFDHRGFGRSTDKAGLGRSAFADDLTALLDHLGLDRVALVGQSMGAGTCINVAARHPQRVAALCIASSLHAIAEEGAVASIMAQARAASDGLPQLDRVLGAPFRAAEPALAFLYAALSGFNDTDRKSLTGTWPQMVAPAALGALGFPILFISGHLDPVFPVDAVRAVQAAVPRSFLVEVQDTGHSVFFERPVEFNDSLLSLLQMAGFKGRRKSVHSNSAGYQPVAR